MSIQTISLSNNQKKQLRNSSKLDSVLFIDDNDDLVVNVAAYETLKQSTNPAPIEAIVGDDVLDFQVEYFVFN
jgi:ASC-1-like (ASCH) protein